MLHPTGTGKTGFRSLVPIGKEFTHIGTGKTVFRSLAPIGKEFIPKGTGFRSLVPIDTELPNIDLERIEISLFYTVQSLNELPSGLRFGDRALRWM
jgi:hypothetical protein